MPSVKIGANHLEYNHDPDECPQCHHGIRPDHLAVNVIQRVQQDGHVLQIIFRCPRHECQRAFIATYAQQYDRHGRPDGLFLFHNSAPYQVKAPDIPAEVVALSPVYADIIKQSHVAEHMDLAQIAGVGYRKALEFLVKDYATRKNPDRKADIQATHLGKCISDFVADPNVKECAQRAAWLGNDETHYTRVWTDKDIGDLKTLIKLTEAWIQCTLLTEKYMKSMGKK